MSYLKTVAIVATALSLSACSLFGGGKVVTTRTTPPGTALVMSADTRAIISREITVSVSKPQPGEPKRKQVKAFCAEPQPDAIRAVAREFAASLKGASEQGEAALSGASREAVAALGRRTPAVQLVRDVLYRLCEAVLNGSLEREQAAPLLDKLDNVIVGVFAIDGLTAMGLPTEKPATAVVKAQAATVPGATPAQGQPQASAEVPIQRPELSADAVKAISEAVVKIVCKVLTREQTPQADCSRS